jgi:hypothetical protein
MQAAGGSSAVDFLREEEPNAVRRLKEGLKLGGLITAAIGIALMIFIAAVDHNGRAYLVGLIPLSIGVAILSYTLLDSTDCRSVNQDPEIFSEGHAAQVFSGRQPREVLAFCSTGRRRAD